MKPCPSCLRTRVIYVDGVCQSCWNLFLDVEVEEETATEKLIKFLLKEVDRHRK